MDLRTLLIVPLLVACGGSRFQGEEEEGISTESATDDFIEDTPARSPSPTDSEETDRAQEAEDFETGDLPGVDGETDVQETDVLETDSAEPVPDPELVDPLIDDFDDGDVLVHDAGGRAGGFWEAFVQTQTPSGDYENPYEDRAPVDQYLLPAGSSGYGGHLQVTDLLGPEAIAQLTVVIPYERKGYSAAAKYAGIQFSACGTGTIRFGVNTYFQRYYISYVEDVWVPYEVDIALSDTWQVYEIPWEQLQESEPEGFEGTFDPMQFTGLSFEFDTSGELWLDDVAFLGGGVVGIEGAPCP